MPIFAWECPDCGSVGEKLDLTGSGYLPPCPDCNGKVERVMTTPAFWKMKGSGGYPSRRKMTGGTAPGTTRATKVWGDYDPTDKSVDYMGQGKKE